MKNTEPFPRIGLIANPDKPLCPGVVGIASRLVLDTGRILVADRITASLMQAPHETMESTIETAHHSDLLLVFGGDGTMLRVARETANSRKPILGINIGGLGFLTAVSSQKLGEALDLVWNKQYSLENRHLISATGTVHSGVLDQLALNDFVIGRSNTSRMIELEVSVDEQVLTRYRCDGLIISSPTGSTAYSLSAGGAVVCPNADVLTITPICPHTLSNRSVIVSLNSCVQVKVISHKLETVLTADGQVQTNLAAGDVVTVKRSRSAVCLMHLTGSSFFETLRQKLNWSGSNIQL